MSSHSTFMVYARSQTNVKVTPGTLVDELRSVSTSVEFNNYFLSVFTKEIADKRSYTSHDVFWQAN